jgi:hypothetical protein
LDALPWYRYPIPLGWLTAAVDMHADTCVNRTYFTLPRIAGRNALYVVKEHDNRLLSRESALAHRYCTSYIVPYATLFCGGAAPGIGRSLAANLLISPGLKPGVSRRTG